MGERLSRDRHLICLDMILTACITQVSFAHCSAHLNFLCHMGGSDLIRGKHHKDMAKASSTSKSVAVQTFFNIHYTIMIL